MLQTPLILRSGSLAVVCMSLILCHPHAAKGDHQLKGTIELGGRNVNVTLYEATEGEPNIIGTDKTNSAGKFKIRSSRVKTSSIFFVAADLGMGAKLVTVLGPELPDRTRINELTTVASSYSMAQFYRQGYISGNSFGLRIAAQMNDNIVEPESGDSSDVLLNSPNADQTNSLRMTRSLANLLEASVENHIVRHLLFLLTATPGGDYPKDTAVAIANLARDPGRNAERIYFLSKLGNSYEPALRWRPDAWTVTVKVNDSGDDSQLFGGPANVAFDSRGYAWVTNNVVQRTPDSSRYLMVLQPNGKPATGGTPDLPVSPITGGGILGAAWGVTVDHHDNVWVGNFGWGSRDPADGNWPTEEPPGNGSVSVVSRDGTPLSLPRGFYGGSYRVQAIEADGRGHIWMASFGNDRVVCFPNGDPTASISYQLHDRAAPFGLAIDKDGFIWVTNSGGLTGIFPSSVAKFELVNGEIRQLFHKPIGDTLKVIDTDSDGNAWFTSQGENKIYAMRPDGSFIDLHYNSKHDGGLDGPWGLTIDGEENVWVSNFGPTALGVFSGGGISKFAGANPNSRPPGTRTGQPLSPKNGYTVPTAGEPVRLHDGTLLNGPTWSYQFYPLSATNQRQN